MMGEESAWREARLACCHELLLPIWERGTGGDPALRRLLEDMDADQDGEEERLRMLLRATGELRRRGAGRPDAEAALLVASACFKAYVGAPEPAWRETFALALTGGGTPTRQAPDT